MAAVKGFGRPILDFYTDRAPDDRGRTYSAILSWDDARLENVHNYIQWLFPLPEPSGANPEAPVLDAATIAAFQADPALREKVHRAFMRMLEFYGLEMDANDIAEGAGFEHKSMNWLHPGNHNHLRISRILRSLRLLGLEKDAQAFFRYLKALYETDLAAGRFRITERTFQFWTIAARSK